jgi:transposase
MKPYSLDFRQKVVEAYEAGGISQRQLAQNFRVTLSFVQGLLKRKRESGTIAPKVRTEQTPTKLNGSIGLSMLAKIDIASFQGFQPPPMVENVHQEHLA